MEFELQVFLPKPFIKFFKAILSHDRGEIVYTPAIHLDSYLILIIFAKHDLIIGFNKQEIAHILGPINDFFVFLNVWKRKVRVFLFFFDKLFGRVKFVCVRNVRVLTEQTRDLGLAPDLKITNNELVFFHGRKKYGKIHKRTIISD